MSFSKSLRPPDFQLLVAIIAGATALALLTTAQAGAALAYEGHSIPWIGLLRARLVDWYAYAIFVPALCWLARRHPVELANSVRTLPLYLLLGLPIALAKETIYVTIGNAFHPGMFSLPNILAEDFSSEVLTAWALIGFAQILAFRDGRRKPEAERVVDHITAREGSAYRLIRTADIEWIDAQGNYARITTARGRFLLRETMTRLETRLGPHFLRVHRRIIVNLDKVERIEARSHGEYAFLLVSGECVISARSFNRSVRPLLQRGVTASLHGH